MNFKIPEFNFENEHVEIYTSLVYNAISYWKYNVRNFTKGERYVFSREKEK